MGAYRLRKGEGARSRCPRAPVQLSPGLPEGPEGVTRQCLKWNSLGYQEVEGWTRTALELS